MTISIELTPETEHLYLIAAECAYHFANKYRSADSGVKLGKNNYHMYWKRNCSVAVYKTKTKVVAIPSLQIQGLDEISHSSIDTDVLD